MLDRVERVIDKIRPALGINAVELVDVVEGVVKIRVFSSTCSAGIGAETVVTLLEEQIQEEIPEIREVLVVD